MHSVFVSLVAVGLATFAQAYTKPGANTWGPLLTPDLTDPVTQGQDFTITWDPQAHATDGVTVSLVLCQGPSSNCVPAENAIASGIPAAQKSYDWKVPCDLAPGTANTDTGYGMLIIVDGTGEFQYSTQFSCLANSSCSSATTSASASSSISATTITSGGSVIILPPTQQTGTTSAPANGTGPHPTTITGTATATSKPFDFGPSSAPGFSFGTSVNYSTLPGTTVISGVTSSPTGDFSFGGSGTSSAPTTTFTGGAAPMGLSGAGIAVAGVAALFAL